MSSRSLVLLSPPSERFLCKPCSTVSDVCGGGDAADWGGTGLSCKLLSMLLTSAAGAAHDCSCARVAFGLSTSLVGVTEGTELDRRRQKPVGEVLRGGDGCVKSDLPGSALTAFGSSLPPKFSRVRDMGRAPAKLARRVPPKCTLVSFSRFLASLRASSRDPGRSPENERRRGPASLFSATDALAPIMRSAAPLEIK
eukprot:1688220-Prymnesium_polylepis.1